MVNKRLLYENLQKKYHLPMLYGQIRLPICTAEQRMEYFAPSHKSPLQGAVWLFIMQRGGREVRYCSREFTVVAVLEEKSLETLLSADFTVVPCFTLVKTKGFNSCVLLLSDGSPPFTS